MAGLVMRTSEQSHKCLLRSATEAISLTTVA